MRSLLPLVRHIARSYATGRRELDDLVQAGTVGAVKAIDRFDVRRPVRLATYASIAIRGEIRRHLRDTSWSVHVPRDVQEVAWRIPEATARIRAELRREPTVEEVACELGVAPSLLSEAESAVAASRPQALAALGVASQGVDPGAPDDALARAETLAPIREAMRTLQGPERTAIGLSYLLECSQRDIGRELGCSQMQVSRILGRALEKLRDHAEDHGAPEARAA